MAPQAVTNVGGSQPHENRPPFLALPFDYRFDRIISHAKLKERGMDKFVGEIRISGFELCPDRMGTM